MALTYTFFFWVNCKKGVYFISAFFKYQQDFIAWIFAPPSVIEKLTTVDIYLKNKTFKVKFLPQCYRPQETIPQILECENASLSKRIYQCFRIYIYIISFIRRTFARIVLEDVITCLLDFKGTATGGSCS